MKKHIFALLAIALIISTFLNGCSFEFRSIDSLMRPPHSSIESELKSSINKLLGNQISYRSPVSGENHSAITIRDINNDGIDEAIVFYVNNSDTSVIRMCVLTEQNNSWLLAGDFAGNGSGIYTVEFSDLNSDNDEEVIVTWLLFEDKSQKVLSVYTSSLVKGNLTVSACLSEPYNLMSVADIYSDGNKQLLVAYSNTSREDKKSTLRLIGIDKNDDVNLINETALDERITSLSALLSDVEPDNDTQRFFVDAMISEGQCITQVFSWNAISEKFVSLLDNSDNHNTTVRSSELLCRDIDNDGVIEIPLKMTMSESVNSDTSLGYLLVWYKVSKNNLIPSEHYVVNVLENYTLYFPQSWKNKVYVKSENAERKWHFVNTDDETLFTISAHLFSDWEENNSEGSEMIMVRNDTVYCCTITDIGLKAGITVSDISNYFSLNI